MPTHCMCAFFTHHSKCDALYFFMKHDSTILSPMQNSMRMLHRLTGFRWFHPLNSPGDAR